MTLGFECGCGAINLLDDDKYNDKSREELEGQSYTCESCGHPVYVRESSSKTNKKKA